MGKVEIPTIICLTPVKNEAWIIRRFLECASTWSDIIILADQQSNDKSLSIAREFSKVRLVINDFDYFDEFRMRSTLIQEARKINGKRILVAIDADEVLSLGQGSHCDLESLMEAVPGTVYWTKLINIKPDLKTCWVPGYQQRIYVDDGGPYKADVIHTHKLPTSENSKEFFLPNLKVLHYQYTDWDRMRSKHNWYQAWETLQFSEKHPLDIYRMYHHMYSIAKKHLKPLRPEWFKGYTDAGIDMFAVNKENSYYWDDLVIQFLKEYGENRFSKIDIWWKEWEGFSDPRTFFEKLFLWYLKKSQPQSHRLPVRAIDKIIRNTI